MNKTIDPKSFTEKIRDAKFWSSASQKFLKGALVAVALQAAPAIANDKQAEQVIASQDVSIAPPSTLTFNKSDHSQYIPGDTIRTLYDSGYADIILNQRSGVYAHPNLPGEIVTLKFESDPDADLRIRADLATLYGDDLGYRWQNSISNMMQGFGVRGGAMNDRSFHIQDPFKIGQDVNFILLKDSDVVKNTLIKGINELSTDQITLYSAIYLMEHEIAHSLPHQQMGFLQLAQTAFNRDDLRSLEVSASFVGIAMVAQQMKKDGLNNEVIAKYLDFKEDSYWSKIGAKGKNDKEYQLANSHEPTLSVSKDTNVTHPVFIAATALRNLFDDNPDAVLSLSRDDVEGLASKLMDMVKQHDFSEDAKLQIEDNLNNNPENQQKIALITSILFAAEEQYRGGDPLVYEEIIAKLNTDQSPFSQKMADLLLENKNSFGKMPPDSIKLMVEDAYRQARLEPFGDGRLNALSTEGQLLLGKTGRLDLIALDAKYKADFARDVLSRYPNYSPPAGKPELSNMNTLQPPGNTPQTRDLLPVSLNGDQLALLKELYNMKDSAHPGTLAVDMQRVLQEAYPDLPDNSWKILSSGLKEGRDLNLMLQDVERYRDDTNAPKPKAELAHTQTPEPDVEYERNRPRPSFGPKPK